MEIASVWSLLGTMLPTLLSSYENGSARLSAQLRPGSARMGSGTALVLERKTELAMAAPLLVAVPDIGDEHPLAVDFL